MPRLEDEAQLGRTSKLETPPASGLRRWLSIGRILDRYPSRKYNRRRYLPVGGLFSPHGLPRSRWLRSLGREDQVVEYFKPLQRPEWMTPEQYAALPASLLVRECR
jgi:hypothetical protein